MVPTIIIIIVVVVVIVIVCFYSGALFPPFEVLGPTRTRIGAVAV
jgi:hypothetical protein